MKIEIDPGVESAIRASIPPDGSVKPLFLNGRLDYLIGQAGPQIPRSEYSKEILETLGYKTTEMILQEMSAPPEAPDRYHPGDIEILEGYVSEAREGIAKVVDELSISKNAKRFISGTLDNVVFQYDLPGASRTETTKSEDGQIRINLNVPDTFRMAFFISRHFGGEPLSPSLFKGVVCYETAHEFGHAIHHALTRPQSAAPHAWYDKRLFDGYPMTMTAHGKYEKNISDCLIRFISHERFAQFFGWEVLRGFGMPRDIRYDYIRTGAMTIFGNGFTFSQMDHFVDGCQQRLYDQEEFDMLSDAEKQNRYTLDGTLIDALIIYSVAPYYTYSKATVEMLVNKGWRGKLRELALQ